MITTATAPRPRIRYGLPDIRDMDVETLNKLYPTKKAMREPMPEPILQYRPLVALSELLMRFFEMAGREAAIFGDGFIYYVDEYGDRVSVAPDLCVVLDLDLEDHGADRSYFIERVGRLPDFVMEIGSRSTASRDLEDKPRIYAHIGIPEYWLFDAEGGHNYGFPLMGLRLVNGEYEPIELDERSDGTARGYSEVLGLTLVYENRSIHVIDPLTGLRLRSPSELEASERAAQQRADEARQETREARQDASAARRRADEAQQEADEAQRRAIAAEAELAELRRRLGDD